MKTIFKITLLFLACIFVSSCLSLSPSYGDDYYKDKYERNGFKGTSSLEVTNISGENTKLTIFVLDEFNESIESLTKEVHIPPSKKGAFGWKDQTTIPLPEGRDIVIYDNVADRCTLSVVPSVTYETTLSTAAVASFDGWEWGGD